MVVLEPFQFSLEVVVKHSDSSSSGLGAFDPTLMRRQDQWKKHNAERSFFGPLAR